MLLGAGLLLQNLRHFPVPPANEGSIDLGPAVGAWAVVAGLYALALGLARRPRS